MTRTATVYATLRRPWIRFLAGRTAQVSGHAWTELGARRIFILPTRVGLGFAALLLVMLLGAINYNNNLIFILTFLLSGLGLVTMLHTYRNLAHLELQAGHGRPAFAGDPVGFQIWLRARDGRPRYALEVSTPAGHMQLTDASPEGDALWLHRPATRRGRLSLGPVIVATRFPLGLFRAWSQLDFIHSEWVYPAPAAPGPPPTPRADAGQGDLGNTGTGQDDFRGLRTYHPGDSLRQVDWKALAREHGLLTKEFAATPASEDWLDFSTTPETDGEARLRRLCRWVLEAERAQRTYGLRLPGRVVPAGRGTTHRDRCLQALAVFEITP